MSTGGETDTESVAETYEVTVSSQNEGKPTKPEPCGTAERKKRKEKALLSSHSRHLTHVTHHLLREPSDNSCLRGGLRGVKTGQCSKHSWRKALVRAQRRHSVQHPHGGEGSTQHVTTDRGQRGPGEGQ